MPKREPRTLASPDVHVLVTCAFPPSVRLAEDAHIDHLERARHGHGCLRWQESVRSPSRQQNGQARTGKPARDEFALTVETDMPAQVGVDPVISQELTMMTNGRTEISSAAPKSMIESTKLRAPSCPRKIWAGDPSKRSLAAPARLAPADGAIRVRPGVREVVHPRYRAMSSGRPPAGHIKGVSKSAVSSWGNETATQPAAGWKRLPPVADSIGRWLGGDHSESAGTKSVAHQFSAGSPFILARRR